MKKIILILILLCFPAWGEWIPININGAGNTVYIEGDFISKKGSYVYYWELENFKKIDEYGVMSAKIYKEADCNKYGYNNLQFFTYSKPMGKGDLISSFNPPKKWTYPPTDSSSYHSLRIACDYPKYIK